MSAARPMPVRCVCGWAGLLAGRSPCPACDRRFTERITPQRGSVLHALQRGEQPVIWPIVRDWLLWARLIVPITARPSPAETRRRRVERRRFAITDAGRLAIGVAVESGATPQEASAG